MLTDPIVLIALGIMATSLAVFAIAIHNAETHPDEWPALQAAEQEQPTVDWFREIRESETPVFAELMVERTRREIDGEAS